MGTIVDPTIIGKEELPEVVEARLQNYPNPFTESAFISFRLKETGEITLQLFGITGKLIATLIDQQTYSKGKHVTRIDATGLGLEPGAYLVRLSSGKDQICTRVLFVGK